MYSLCFKPYTNYTLNYTLRRSKNLHSERPKAYTASVQNPTQRAFAKLYTRRNTNPTFCFWTRISRMEFRTRISRMEFRTRMERMVRMEFRTRMERMVRMEFRTRMERMVRMEFRTRMERMEFRTRMKRIVRNVCNERNERNERYKRNERKTGNGNKRWRASSLLRVAQKNPTILSEFSAIQH